VASLGYDHLTLLPPLGEPGAPPPMTGAELLAHVTETPAEELVAVILLQEDLHIRESHLSGSPDPAGRGPEEGVDDVYRPAVLTSRQAQGLEPLPYPLSAAGDRELVPGDAVWAAYYRWARVTADRLGSEFLRAWVSLEVGLRNALATARARTLGLEPGRYLVAPELGRGGWEPVVAEWAAAPDPLAGFQVLVRARWEWLREHNGWFTFAPDELGAYAAGLILLRRWQRVLRGRDPAGAVR
jgi:hypothetical protein